MNWAIKNTGSIGNLIQNQRPHARAAIHGQGDYKDIIGEVVFYQVNNGVLVVAEVNGLPHSDDYCSGMVYALHIHDGESCTGNATDPYANTGMHYNPGKCIHPQHAGDLPPLFENNGYAWMSFVTNRFKVDDVDGKTVIIHSNPDDFRTQPSGDSGTKIACGVIRRV